ncbi:MAG: caspase family protein [Scytonema sp. PMC 1069.18]|nr:caspase family protein [Scytonema sp. PMC 1069.18]MEC4885149.1 caspase family protein [Scytonema sp. PMC 1070.18]
MKRRTFLQKFGSILAVLGATEAEWLTLGNRYYQALAQTRPRKLALLVGINQYPHSPALTGCLTDVELQRELLIHRFSFQPSDILCLTEEKATRESIETAFSEHLVKQAQPDDLVVFHFSGYGSYVKSAREQEQNALVLIADKNKIQESHNVNYLLEEYVHLMLRSLPTNHVTAILDTSFYTPSVYIPSALRIRSHRVPVEAIVANELEFQKQLQDKISSSQSALVLKATSHPRDLAQELQLSGFSAGLFTYALTQSLWEATPATTIQFCMSQAAGSVQRFGSNQQWPTLLIEGKNQQTPIRLSENFLPNSILGAEGVVTGIEEDGKTFQLWLGGFPAQVLEYLGNNSRLTIETQSGLTAQLTVRSRAGLTAKAQLVNVESGVIPQVGQLVRETVRLLPRSVSLVIALDPKLERIERVDSTSAFATFSRVTSVVAGEQPADYVFGRLPETKIKDLAATSSSLVSLSRYSLFSLGGEQIPNTVGEAGEAVKVSALRLGLKLQALLAAKLWRLTNNQGSSRLGVRATLEVMGTLSPRALMQQQTVRTQTTDTSGKKSYSPETGEIPSVATGNRIQFRLENLSDRPVYFMLLGLNSGRIPMALFSWYRNIEIADSEPRLQNVVIAPGETLTVPQTTPGMDWVVQGPAFLSESQLIFSTSPFTQTLIAMEAVKHTKAEQQRIQSLLNPLEVTQAVLQDLHNASSVTETNGSTADSYELDVNHWASFSFVYQVV